MCISRREMLALTGAALVILPGCTQATGPADVRWGKEACAYCGMLVDDPRFAAQIRDPKGKVFKFDDTGDAVLWLANQTFANDPAAEFWVGDCENRGWLDARAAWYRTGMHTPMAHGFGAVPDRRESLLSFAEMSALVLAKGSTTRCETPDEQRT